MSCHYFFLRKLHNSKHQVVCIVTNLDKETFKKFLDEGRFHQVPPGTVADHYILKLADADNAKILSNEYKAEFYAQLGGKDVAIKYYEKVIDEIKDKKDE